MGWVISKQGSKGGWVIFLLGSAFFVSVSVNYVISPVLPTIARAFGIGIGQAGSLVAVYGLCYACFALLLGPISDYFGRKPMIVSALLSFAVLTLLCGVARGYGGLLVLRALAGISAAMMQPATWGYLGDYFPYETRGTAAAWVMQAGSIALIAGVPAGGLIAEFLGWRWIFIVAGLLGLGVAALVTVSLPSLPTGRSPSQRDSGQPRRLVKNVFGSLMRDRRARSALLVSFLIWLGFFALYTYVGAFLQERFGLNSAETGFVTLTVGIGYVLGGQAGGRLSDRVGRRAVVLSGLAWLGIVLAVVPNIRSLPLATGAILAMGFGFFFTYAAQVTLMTELLPQARSTMMSVNYFFTYIGLTAGSAVGAVLLAWRGFAAIGAMSALACLAAALVAGRFVFTGGPDASPNAGT
jgi:predicted MFS family arabinose efflux permease